MAVPADVQTYLDRLPDRLRTRLELVVISAAAAASPGAKPRWELNLDTGEDEPDHIGLNPAGEPAGTCRAFS